ncbi:GNAT family N-acetyltransferase [Variovorax sp. ZS18.2.2]|uniref:GNAT family N-acetyltransferase n=1 Tax=Variovorax sp. ZS18.2.2 TaxID=2971255 RepID=UPI0021518523|nr:GNAT family N-acetyltransferase [Variovorax sp. ZS18.2.2]MCR6480412.1 GNAT family N-acetyltransferase [Variovorax sp. ZS18.2.2]
MLELNPSEYHRVASFFDSLPYGLSVPNSVIAGIGHGRAFANDLARPTAALVYNNGACTVAGIVDDFVFAKQVCQWLLEYHGSDYFILYAFPEAWEPVLEGFLGSATKRRRRFDFDFNRAKFIQHGGRVEGVPTGYEIRRIDEPLMQQIRDVANPYSRSYWKSAAAFAQHGIGFCALHNDAIVGMCYTAFAWQGHHDIDILTVEGHQRRGLGTLMARAFIEDCLQHGLDPNWDCWTDNQPSVALAEKLGFEPRVEVQTFHGVRP